MPARTNGWVRVTSQCTIASKLTIITDMVAAEEDRIKEREAAVKAREEADRKEGKKVKAHGDAEHGTPDKGSIRAP